MSNRVKQEDAGGRATADGRAFPILVYYSSAITHRTSTTYYVQPHSKRSFSQNLLRSEDEYLVQSCLTPHGKFIMDLTDSNLWAQISTRILENVPDIQSIRDSDATGSTVPVPGSKLCSQLSLEQTFSYYQQYPKDRPVLETFHMVLVTHMSYKYLITNFGDYAAIQRNIWSFNLHVVTTVFFIHRCWMLDKGRFNTLVSAFILVLALVQIAFGCASAAFAQRGHCALALEIAHWPFPDKQSHHETYYMDNQHWDSHQFTAFDKTLIDVFCTIVLAKFYANTLLATLNNRRNFADNLNNAQAISLSSFARRQDNTKMLGVHVTTHTDVMINPQYQHSQNLEPALSSVDDKTSDGTDWKN
ncbi:hypothetical protein BU17DRAFT_70808 [Hysterangium stoloniferum]|nr:hypothetical protein BU17DRAFT_70808 [Hysterangium stoloniferum]